jgi:hypothetical protein
MMGTESASGTLADVNNLTGLTARANFLALFCRENLKTYRLRVIKYRLLRKVLGLRRGK